MNAVCRIKEIGFPHRSVIAVVDGATCLPVWMPSKILERAGVLVAGGKFCWNMPEDGTVRVEDISPYTEPLFSAEEEAELDRLYAHLGKKENENGS